MKIRDRVFGAPVDQEIIDIFNDLQGKQQEVDPTEPIGQRVGKNFYLGERTTFARMWTAVNVIGVEKKPKQEGEQETDPYYYDTVYYVINDNKQDSYSPNESVGKRVSQLSGAETGGDANPYLKPAAGITSITTKTEGSAGVIKRTTVNFVVHDKNDYENIFLPFFLKPGTSVCLDFGWSVTGEDTQLYSIEDVVSRTIGDDKKVVSTAMENFYTDIFGRGSDPKDEDYKVGYLRKQSNRGRVQVLFGDVTNYNTTFKSDGSYECSLEFVTQNASVIDHEVSEENNLKFVFGEILEDLLIAGISGRDANSFVQSIDALKMISDEERSKLILGYFDSKIKGETNPGVIPKSSRRIGVFHQEISDFNANFPTNKEVLYISFGLFEDIFLNNLIVKKSNNSDNRHENKFISHDCYVRWNENLFNRQTAQFVENEDLPLFMYPGGPDSDYWNDTYNSRQRPETESDVVVPTTINYTIVSGDTLSKVAKKYSTTASAIQKENQIENPNLISVGQVLKIPQNETSSAPSTSALINEDVSLNRMPIRDLFISVELIKESFSKKNTVNDALVEIFYKINEDSNGIFDIKMIGQNDSNTIIGFQDINLLPPELKPKQLVFDVTSGNSIVLNMDLKYEMPKGGLGNQVAIQNYNGPESFFDIKQLDEFRFLDLLDLDKMGFIAEKDLDRDGTNEQTLYLRSLPRRLNEDGTEFSNTSEYSFEYDDVLGGLNKIAESDTSDDFEYVSIRDSMGENDYKRYMDQIYMKIGRLQEGEELKEQIASGKNIPKDDLSYTIYASSFRDKFLKQAYIDIFIGDDGKGSIAPMLPFTLTLTIYGNTYLKIGDYISVNNLPKTYVDNSIFQILEIEDSLTTNGWQTTYTTAFKVLPEKKRLVGDGNVYTVRFAGKFQQQLIEKSMGFDSQNQGTLLNTDPAEIKETIIDKKPKKYFNVFEMGFNLEKRLRTLDAYKDGKYPYNINIIQNLPYEQVSTLSQFAYMLAYGKIIYQLTIASNVGAKVPVNFKSFDKYSYSQEASPEGDKNYGTQTLWFLVGTKVKDHIIANFEFNSAEYNVVQEYLKVNSNFNKNVSNLIYESALKEKFPTWYNGEVNPQQRSDNPLTNALEEVHLSHIYQPVLIGSFHSVFQTTSGFNEEAKKIYKRFAGAQIIQDNKANPPDTQDESSMVSGQRVCNPIGELETHEGHSFFISNQLLEIAGVNISDVVTNFVDTYNEIFKTLNRAVIEAKKEKKNLITAGSSEKSWWQKLTS